jgi:hypothetical protein
MTTSAEMIRCVAQPGAKSFSPAKESRCGVMKASPCPSTQCDSTYHSTRDFRDTARICLKELATSGIRRGYALRKWTAPNMGHMHRSNGLVRTTGNGLFHPEIFRSNPEKSPTGLASAVFFSKTRSQWRSGNQIGGGVSRACPGSHPESSDILRSSVGRNRSRLPHRNQKDHRAITSSRQSGLTDVRAPIGRSNYDECRCPELPTEGMM